MYLWHISRTDKGGYDTYSDAVVVAPTEAEARLMHPRNRQEHDDGEHLVWTEWGFWAYVWSLKHVDGWKPEEYACPDHSWPDPSMLKVERLGLADDPTPCVACASYHAS